MAGLGFDRHCGQKMCALMSEKTLAVAVGDHVERLRRLRLEQLEHIAWLGGPLPPDSQAVGMLSLIETELELVQTRLGSVPDDEAQVNRRSPRPAPANCW
jgi:hypothetical protein